MAESRRRTLTDGSLVTRDSAGVHKWHYQPDRDLANISHDIDNYQRVNHYDEDIDWWEGHPDDRDYRNSWDEASERDYGDRRFGF